MQDIHFRINITQMNFIDIPCTEIDWDEILITKLPGESGYSYWRLFETANIRIRMVEYSAGYRSAHWCSRGHVIHMLEGEMIIEQRDGTIINLRKGMTYCFSDKPDNPHKSFTYEGTSLLIID